MISHNESLVHLNLGSIKGANRNRLGRDGGMSVALGFCKGKSLIQHLSLRSTTLGNDEVEALADSLEDNLFIKHLDLSENRLEGSRAGHAIARIIQRQNEQKGGENIEDLILSHNKLGVNGFHPINAVLLAHNISVVKLDLGYN
mmetsp:Transcript_8870/g.12142  ORF Transcript_8870/g.12142 Transcript_8870/m.12142 type:complete len:144 (+) Transcript_8870:636-1067(+)